MSIIGRRSAIQATPPSAPTPIATAPQGPSHASPPGEDERRNGDRRDAMRDGVVARRGRSCGGRLPGRAHRPHRPARPRPCARSAGPASFATTVTVSPGASDVGENPARPMSADTTPPAARVVVIATTTRPPARGFGGRTSSLLHLLVRDARPMRLLARRSPGLNGATVHPCAPLRQEAFAPPSTRRSHAGLQRLPAAMDPDLSRPCKPDRRCLSGRRRRPGLRLRLRRWRSHQHGTDHQPACRGG